jgi:hypothetical protein
LSGKSLLLFYTFSKYEDFAEKGLS